MPFSLIVFCLCQVFRANNQVVILDARSAFLRLNEIHLGLALKVRGYQYTLSQSHGKEIISLSLPPFSFLIQESQHTAW